MQKEDLAFLYGCIIGDGCIRSIKEKYFVFKIRHCLKQKDYLLYKASIINRIFNTFNVVKDINNNGYPGCDYYLYNSELKDLYNLFYPNNKKQIVNSEIINNLSPEALAIWWMDDGCLSLIKNKQGKIRARQGFLNTYLSKEDNLKLIELLNSKFNLNLKNVKDRKAYRIRLNTQDLKELIPIIKPYIHPIFNYKIDMQY